MQKLTQKEFIQKAKTVHGDLYSYVEVIYVGALVKVKIKCPNHGIWESTPNNHLKGTICPVCSKEKRTSNTEEFIQKATAVHGDLYLYDEVLYKNNSTKVKIKCSEHGIWETTPEIHLGNHGCPVCAREKTNYQKYKNKKTTLYYIYLPEYNLYKIGLTQTSVKVRFKKDIKRGLKIEILTTKYFDDGYEAFLLEQQILNNFKEHQYQGPKILIGGNTELFLCDCFII